MAMRSVSYESAMQIDSTPPSGNPEGVPTPQRFRDEVVGLAETLGYSDVLRDLITSAPVRYDKHKLQRIADMLGEVAIGRLAEMGISLDDEEVTNNGA